MDTSEAGRKGGKARAKKLTPTERREWAIEANKVRWGKRKNSAKKRRAK